MKVKVVFDWTDFVMLEFEVEGADWQIVLEQLKAHAEAFEKADRELYPDAYKNRFRRFFGL